MKRYKSQMLMSEINITPFTDVILVLLIIFMIATPLLSHNNIEVKLPVSSSKETMTDPKQVNIVITGEGIVYLDNELLTSKKLKERITGMLKQNPDLKVIMSADQSCRFQEIVGVIDILKETGVKSLNIATKTSSKRL